MLFKKRVGHCLPRFNIENTPSREEAGQLLKTIRKNSAITRKTSKKNVFGSIVVAFFIIIVVAGLLSFVDKTFSSRQFFVKAGDEETKFEEKSITEIINNGYIGKINEGNELELSLK